MRRHSFKQRLSAILLCTLTLSSVPRASADVALWSLRSAQGGEAVLMGTIHLLPQTDAWQSVALKSAVTNAEVLVLEALLDSSNAAQIQQFSVANGFVTDSAQFLPNMLDRADLARLRAAEMQLPVPAQAFDRMQPWFAALNISIAYASQNGYTAQAGAEQWLRSRFRNTGRSIGALEGPIAGLTKLAAMPPSIQMEMLRATLAQVEAGGDAIAGLYDAWQTGNLEDLTTILMAPEQFHPDVHAAVLVERNAAWVTPVLNYLATPERELIAVGAAHLLGPGNLIDMLREAGVTVEPLE
ncbi:MAG: TraB/GumN family protein [Pseudomonadota bacterium]